jgi:S-adenosylmethionine hydrolase
MPIVTLTTDYGTTDSYIAEIKGSILTQTNQVSFIDVSHDIRKFDLYHGAHVVRNAFHSFPEGTLHLVSVGVFSPDSSYALSLYKGHHFCGPDNGVMSLIFEGLRATHNLITLPLPKEFNSFPAKFFFPIVAHHIAQGGTPEIIASAVPSLRPVFSPKPVIMNDLIRANIQYIDEFGNLITNLETSEFEKVRAGRSFSIRFRLPGFRTQTISEHYNSVDEGDIVALFNQHGFLEIAINSGNASQLLGVQINDLISISFNDR